MALVKYAKTCAKNIPGNSKVFITEIANISSVTVGTGLVKAVTMATGKKFQQFGADPDTVQFTQEGKGKSSYNETYKMTMKFSKKSSTLISAKNELVDASVCGVAVIRQDSNGACFLSGWNNADKNGRPYNEIQVNFDSGTKPTDEESNAYTIVLTGMSGYDELPFNTTLTNAIIAGTATATAFIAYN